jgi:hypothetical protein
VRLICEAGTRRRDHVCHGSAVGILAIDDEEDINRLRVNLFVLRIASKCHWKQKDP